MHEYTEMTTQKLTSNQSVDTLTRVQLSSNMSARLLSVRCREAQTQALCNQDYASLVSLNDGSSLCFCVCDGVGSSYKGDFAAHYLATHLLTWLQEMTEIPQDIATFTSTLHGLLDLWAYDARMQLKKVVLPSETPQLAREVMEELRDTYGSETVFLCGRIDTKESSRSTQAIVCWMGNVTARLSLPSDQRIILGNTNDRSGRWSTVQGRRGTVDIWHATFTALERLVIHTDGLDTIGENLALLTDDEWHTQIQDLLLLPKNDDMTALEICWGITG